MDRVTDKEIIRVESVTSAGNSWIICRSKSYPGRVYYFNTLTGAAAWNLSDADIEKARSTTKKFANEGRDIPTKEPEEPPNAEPAMEPSPSNNPQPKQKVSSTIYNKQVINNRFARQQMPYSPFIVSPCNPVVRSAITPLMPLGVNAPLNLTAFNNGVWSVPPPHQILLASTVSPLLNSNQNTQYYGVNQEHVIDVHNTSTSLSGRFQNLRNDRVFQKAPQQHIRQNVFNRARQNNRFAQKTYQRQIKKNLSQDDLRTFLISKRRSSESQVEKRDDFQGPSDDANIAENANSVEEKMKTVEEIVNQQKANPLEEKHEGLDVDSDWLEENIFVDGKKLKLDIVKLKKLAKPNMDPKIWYIVTDDDVLLNHLNFLNTLFNSDDDCQLMVPTQVIALLQNMTSSVGEIRTKSRARRALAFIKQLLDSNYLVTGEGSDPEDTESNYLLCCALSIFRQNNHVIILSNNAELAMSKNSTQIPVFTIREMKQFLANPVPQTEAKKTEVMHPVETPIKITVANDYAYDPDQKQVITSTNSETQTDTTAEIIECGDILVPDNDSEKTAKCSELSFKRTMDASIQTDPLQVATPPHVSRIETINSLTSSEHSFIPTKEVSTDICKVLSTTKTQNQLKKREIRLNRSTPIKTGTSHDSVLEKKQFKWRKKTSHADKAVSSANSSKANQHSTETLPELANKETSTCEVNLSEKHPNYDLSNKSMSKQIDNVINYESCSDASSVNLSRHATNERVIIDETSTSGIVSNTASNVDSESDQRINLAKEGYIKKFVVKDQSMGDFLRMRCDEWMSRLMQIMEEMLTQVLRQDYRFLCNVVYKLHGGGPWSIVEATDCIIRKFNTSPNIVDAAKKLMNYYLKISDDTGRVNMDLPPAEYMEMYSHAVCLVVELQSELHDFEDLQTAGRSLKKLLDDIQNPNLDTSHNDTFEDPPHDVLADVPFVVPVPAESGTNVNENVHETVNSIHNTTKITTPVASQHSSPTKVPSQSPQRKHYNLRSKDRTPLQSPQSKKQTRDKAAENKFFANLNLRKISDTEPRICKTPQKLSTRPPTTPTKTVKPSGKTVESSSTPTKTARASGKTVEPSSTPTKTAGPSGKTVEPSSTPTKTAGPSAKTVEPLNTPTKTAGPSGKTFESSSTPTKTAGPSGKTVEPSSTPTKTAGPSGKTVEPSSTPTKTAGPSGKTVEPSSTPTKTDLLAPNEVTNTINVEPKVVRKFVFCDKYEKKLSMNRQPLDLDALNYYSEEDLDLPVDEGEQTYPEMENLHMEQTGDVEVALEEQAYDSDCNLRSLARESCNVNYKLNYIFTRLVKEVSQNLSDIRDFCIVACKHLNDPTYSTVSKLEMLDKAKHLHELLDNLCKSLSGIFSRESNDPENNIHAVLIAAGIDEPDLDNNQLHAYKDVIGKSLEQAKILQEVVGSFI